MTRQSYIKAFVNEIKTQGFVVVPDVFEEEFKDAAAAEGLNAVDEVYLKAGDYEKYPLGGTGYNLES